MDHDSSSNGPGALAPPRRNNYFYGKLMDVLHFQQEQAYVNRKRWLLNRMSVGEGVLHGLEVEAHDGQVCVKPGLAIDALGREIIVPRRVCLDPWQLTDSCGATGGRLSVDLEHTVSVCLVYRECAADYVPVLVTDCNTREDTAPGTIVESFCLLVREGQPDPVPEKLDPAICQALLAQAEENAPVLSPADLRRLLCQGPSAAVAAVPDKPCVTLAMVTLQPGGTLGAIDTCTYRPIVYSNAMLLELILCLAARMQECCGSTAPQQGDT